MDISFYIIKHNDRRENALSDENGFRNQILLVSVGIVTSPTLFNNSKKENPFKPNDLVMIVAGATNEDLIKYPSWLFTKGECCCVMEKLIVDEGDENIKILGIRELKIKDCFIHFALQWERERKRKNHKDKNRRIQCLTTDYLLKTTLEKYKHLLELTKSGEFEKAISFGVVSKPLKYQKPSKKRSMNLHPNDLLILVRNVKEADVKQYRRLFVKGEYCQIQELKAKLVREKNIVIIEEIDQLPEDVFFHQLVESAGIKSKSDL